jgi:hypothetical protein
LVTVYDGHVNAIYNNRAYKVDDTEGDHIILNDGSGTFRVPLSDQSLIIEPTDDEMAEVEMGG